MVYRSDCRYLPYSIHVSEFIYANFVHEKMGKNARILEVCHFRMIRKWPPTVTRRAKHYSERASLTFNIIIITVPGKVVRETFFKKIRPPPCNTFSVTRLRKKFTNLFVVTRLWVWYLARATFLFFSFLFFSFSFFLFFYFLFASSGEAKQLARVSASIYILYYGIFAIKERVCTL